MNRQDVIVIGAGIVGLSTAMQLLEKQPHLAVTILEKEADIAIHQTGHNGGVMHSGIYYTPGSLRAKNCQTGYDFVVRRQKRVLNVWNAPSPAACLVIGDYISDMALNSVEV